MRYLSPTYETPDASSLATRLVIAIGADSQCAEIIKIVFGFSKPPAIAASSLLQTVDGSER
jgi:hypothetical protein